MANTRRARCDRSVLRPPLGKPAKPASSGQRWWLSQGRSAPPYFRHEELYRLAGQSPGQQSPGTLRETRSDICAEVRFGSPSSEGFSSVWVRLSPCRRPPDSGRALKLGQLASKRDLYRAAPRRATAFL